MPEWREFTIKDFKGIASANSTPSLNECQIVKNFDSREISGTLNSRQGYTLKYPEPSPYIYGYQGASNPISNIVTLSSCNFFIPDLGGGKEVTLVVQAGYLNPQVGCSAEGSNLLCFLIRPFWNGSLWVDDWQWLNESILTNIASKGNIETGILEINADDIFPENYLTRYSVINVSKSPDVVTAQVLCSGQWPTNQNTKIILNHLALDWNVGDNILLMKNYIPLEYLKAMALSVQANDITFHKVLNDIRIGFGGYVNRLGISIGYKKHYYCITLPNNADPMALANLQNYSTINQIILDPFVPTAENNWLELNLIESNSGNLSSGTWQFNITAILDDYNEFPVCQGSLPITAGKGIDLYLKVKSGQYNKRITKFGVYCRKVNEPYYKVYEIPFTFNTYDTEARLGWTITMDGTFTPILSPVFKLTSSVWNNKGTELSEQLGYTPTQQFALSWDQAVVISGKTFLVNPFIDKRYLNKIFFSPVSGDGAWQYDVIPAENYHDLENFDGNELIGIEFLPNLDYMAFKRNSVQRVDSDTGRSVDISLGKGCISRKSIVNFGNYIAWCGDNDIYITDGNSYKTISDKTIRDQYRKLTTKQNIIAVREEKDNAYKFFSADTIAGTEFILTKNGWFSFVGDLYPGQYMQSRDGLAWFIHNGNIYRPGGDSDIDLNIQSKGISLQWKSVKIDHNFSGSEDLKYTNLFFLRSVHIKYSYSSQEKPAFNIKVYFDGNLFQQLNFDAKGDYTIDHKDLMQGARGKYFELELNVPNTISPFILYEIGVLWKPVPIGRV